MIILKGRPWPSAYPFISLLMLFWPNCCHNHLICQPREKITATTSFTFLHVATSSLCLSFCPYHELFGKAQLYPLLSPSPLKFPSSCFHPLSPVCCVEFIFVSLVTLIRKWLEASPGLQPQQALCC